MKSKLYKYFSLIGKFKWVGEPMNNIVYTYNNSVHSITKYKPKDVNDSNEVIIKRNIRKRYNTLIKSKNKLNVGDSVRISKYKAEFQKGYTPNWSTEIFTIAKVNKTNPITYAIEDQKKQHILGSFYEQELQKTKYSDVYLVEKVLKRKDNKLYVKWLGLKDSENSWIDKKSVV